MAKLINMTKSGGLKHATYGQVCPLEKEISLIGSNQNCDVVLQLYGLVSRQHAFIIREKESFYVGDISRRGTYLHARKLIFGYYAKVQLRNVLETSCVRDAIEKDKDFRFKRVESIVDRTFDDLEARRNYFLGQFLKERGSVERLIEKTELLNLCNRDIIEIYPGFMLKFKK